jgi:hypothetical protein
MNSQSWKNKLLVEVVKLLLCTNNMLRGMCRECTGKAAMQCPIQWAMGNLSPGAK